MVKMSITRTINGAARSINNNNNNNNNISKAPFPNGPKALFTRLKIQIYNKTLKKLKEVKSNKIIKINNYNKVINLKSTLKDSKE